MEFTKEYCYVFISFITFHYLFFCDLPLVDLNEKRPAQENEYHTTTCRQVTFSVTMLEMMEVSAPVLYFCN